MRKLKEIYDIVIHHSKSIGGNRVFMYQIAVIDRGWADISYHFIITNGKPMRNKQGKETWPSSPDGKVEIGRTLNWQGAHVGGHNEHSIGICLIGDFNKTKPTEKQLKSLVNLLAVLCNMYKVPVEKILGHQDVGSSNCPGENLYKLLPEIREKVDLEIKRMSLLTKLRIRLGLIGKLVQK